MQMLRDVSNTRFQESVHGCKCGFLLVVWGKPSAILGLAIKTSVLDSSVSEEIVARNSRHPSRTA